MRSTRVFFVLILLLFLTIALQNSSFKTQDKKDEKIEVMPSPKAKPQATQVPSPTEKIEVIVPTLAPTALPAVDNSYVYPNSFNYSKNGNRISFQTVDSPQTVTDWYKAKISSLGFSAQSFVQTSSNDNVLNKLVAANGEKEIRVEISKDSGNQITEIRLFLRNF